MQKLSDYVILIKTGETGGNQREHFTEIFYHASTIDSLVHKKHSHEGYEIIQPIPGGGRVLIKNNVYQMSADSVCFINASEIHCTNPADMDNYVRNKVLITQDYLFYLSSDLGLPPLSPSFS